MTNQAKTILAGFLTVFIVAGFALALGMYSAQQEQPKNFQTQSLAEIPQEIDLKIKGNKKSKIYHLPGCPNYNDIADRNIRWFKNHEEAESARYRIARNC